MYYWSQFTGREGFSLYWLYKAYKLLFLTWLQKAKQVFCTGWKKAENVLIIKAKNDKMTRQDKRIIPQVPQLVKYESYTEVIRKVYHLKLLCKVCSAWCHWMPRSEAGGSSANPKNWIETAPRRVGGILHARCHGG